MTLHFSFHTPDMSISVGSRRGGASCVPPSVLFGGGANRAGPRQNDFDHVMNRLFPSSTVQDASAPASLTSRLQQAAGRVQDQAPQDATSYQVQQSEGALISSGQRLAGERSIPYRFRSELTGELSQLSREQGPGRRTQHTAQRISDTLDKIAALSPYTSAAVNGTVSQMQSDDSYLQQAAARPRMGQAPAPNTIAPQVQDLANQTGSQAASCGYNPAGTYGEDPQQALLSIEQDLQNVAVNAGGSEMPQDVQDRLQDLVSTVNDAANGSTSLADAPLAIGAKLNDFVTTLKSETGGTYGIQNSLQAMTQDLGRLTQANAAQADPSQAYYSQAYSSQADSYQADAMQEQYQTILQQLQQGTAPDAATA